MNENTTKICIIGNMGSGKSTVYNMLQTTILHNIIDFDLEFTDRDARENETDGKDYHFVSNDIFNELNDKNMLVGVTGFDTVHGKFRYGSERYVWCKNKSSIIVTNPTAVTRLKENSSIPQNIKVIYLHCPEILARKRLSQRGDSPEEINRRLSDDQSAFADAMKYVDIKIDTSLYDIGDIVNMLVEYVWGLVIPAPKNTFHVNNSLYGFTCEITRSMDRYVLPNASIRGTRTYLVLDRLTDSSREGYQLFIRYPGATRGIIFCDKYGMVTDIRFDKDTCYTRLSTYDMSMEELIPEYIGWGFPLNVLSIFEQEREGLMSDDTGHDDL